MSEELEQKGLYSNGKITPPKIEDVEVWDLGATSFNQLKKLRHFSGIPSSNKKPDLFLYNNMEGFICFTEFKSKLDTPSKIEKAKKQCIENYCLPCKCKLAIVSDFKVCYFFNALNGEAILDENGNEIKRDVDFKNLSQHDLDLFKEINKNLDQNNSKIKKSNKIDPSPLVNIIWQKIYAEKKLSPTKSLLTFIEFFMFKYLSDLNVLDKHNSLHISFDHLFSKVAQEDRLTYYLNHIRPSIKSKFPESDFPEPFSKDKTTIFNGFPLNNNNIDDTELFNDIIHVLKAYPKLTNIDKDFKTKLYEYFFKGSNEIQHLGKFFTPRNLIKALLELSDIENLPDGSVVCDPACGVGGFLLEAFNGLRRDDFYIDKENKVKTRLKYRGYEIKEDNDDLLTMILAKANFIIHSSDFLENNPNKTQDFADIFNNIFSCYTDNNTGSLSEINQEEYDLILSNPPYLNKGTGSLKKKLPLDFNLNGSGLEGMFVEKIIKELKKGGRAIIILPDSFFDKRQNITLRKYIYDRFIVEGIISLPNDVFYNTSQKTSVMIIKKPLDETSLRRENIKIFTYHVKAIGESLDKYRYATEVNDLPNLVHELKRFRIDKNNFKTEDSRVYILKHEEINSDYNFNPTFYMSKEKKSALGILNVKKDRNISSTVTRLEDFLTAIESIKKKIAGISELDVDYIEYNMDDIFDFSVGSGNSLLTKAFIKDESNKGDIPVYGSFVDKDKVKGYISSDLKKINYYENCLRINTNGTNSGITHYQECKFAISGDARALIVKEEYRELLNYEFLQRAMSEIKQDNNFNWSNKSGKEKLKNITIKIPHRSKKICLSSQKKIVEHSKLIEKLSQLVLELNLELESSSYKIN